MHVVNWVKFRDKFFLDFSGHISQQCSLFDGRLARTQEKTKAFVSLKEDFIE